MMYEILQETEENCWFEKCVIYVRSSWQFQPFYRQKRIIFSVADPGGGAQAPVDRRLLKNLCVKSCKTLTSDPVKKIFLGPLPVYLKL